MEGPARGPSISADGRFVTFYTNTPNVVPGVPLNPDFPSFTITQVYVFNRVMRTTEIVSVANDGTPANAYSGKSEISADGRYVVFEAEATNLLPGLTPSNQRIFVRDRVAGTTELASVSSNGEPGACCSQEPSISADGRFVAFASLASNLVPNDANNTWDIFVRDLITRQTERVSLTSTGAEIMGGGATVQSISGDGRYVAFESQFNGVVPGDTNTILHKGNPIPVSDVFVRDREGTPDANPPSISCAGPDGAWHAADVTIACSATDSGSGLANPSDASFTLSTSVVTGTETANASTNSRTVCDQAGNCSTAGPIGGNKVDKKPPSITITAPASTTYLLNQAVVANYACTDGGSGVASCAGTVPNGSNIDTGSVGTKTFTVNSTDNVGNVSSQSVSYRVTYNTCLLYDPTKAVNSGAVISIKLQLCDAVGNNMSSSGTTVTAQGIALVSTNISGQLQDAGNANPDNNFRFDPILGGTGGYIYNLSTKGLTIGTYNLTFMVSGDPTTHTVQFQVK